MSCLSAIILIIGIAYLPIFPFAVVVVLLDLICKALFDKKRK